MTDLASIAVVGGSGFYEFLEDAEELKIDTPFGADGTITMRDDHTTIGYAIGWGQTTPKEPFIIDVKAADWGKILEHETEWKKQQKYI